MSRENQCHPHRLQAACDLAAATTASPAQGDFARAIQNYTRAIELRPAYADAYNNRGNAYGAIGQHDPAIRDYTKTIELKPDYAEAYNNRGNAYFFLKEYDKAWADVKMCRQLGRPPSAELVRKLAGATGRVE